MDVVYPVRAGDRNEELRYSLRSLTAHLDHDRVFVVGHRPPWLINVEVIDGGNAAGCSAANVYHNILTACGRDDLTDEILVFNDDFYITDPVSEVAVMHRGSLTKHAVAVTERGWWRESLELTLACLNALGIADPISYELHVPLPVHRLTMVEILSMYAQVCPDNPPQWRSLYGNLARIGGMKLDVDPKIGHAAARRRLLRPYHSTSDASWLVWRRELRRRFPNRCRYERSC